jgi:serine/threonine-protein kinase HipA
MLDVYTDKHRVGSLFATSTERDKYGFGYDRDCGEDWAVSITMPITSEQYLSEAKSLHPIFDMNLPEGALADRLRREFSKTIPNFDSLAMLQIVGRTQIGRLRFATSQEPLAEIPTQNIAELLAHDGAKGLFASLLDKYARHSGVSGAQPKVLIRDGASVERITHTGATHIVKAWTNEFPRLAEVEYFCMRAAMHSGLETPPMKLSNGGTFLVIERFDLVDGRYLGFEDFCVLNGKVATQKYDGSYENIVKRIRQFVSPENIPKAIEDFFKMLVLSCVVKNGDAHLKNFGMLYETPSSSVKLAPAYDIVTTTLYNKADILALTLAGSKRWPAMKTLSDFGRRQCNLGFKQITHLVEEVQAGVAIATREAELHIDSTESFKETGKAMLGQWGVGMAQLAY